MNKALVGLALASISATTHAQAADFTSPAGQLGAGLGTGSETKGRAYFDGSAYLRFGTQDFFGTEVRTTQYALPFLLGGGYKIMPELEIEGRLGVAAANLKQKALDCPDGIDPDDCEDSVGSFTPANLYVGANYLIQKDAWLAKVGGGLAFGPWTLDPNIDRVIAYAYSAFTRLEDFYMYVPETLAIVAPARLEYRMLDNLALTGDVSLAFYIPTDGGDPEMVAALAPGAGYEIADFTVGGRLPVFWMFTDDMAQFSVEPFARYDFSNMFATARYTLNLDDPLGFSFDEGNYWALHLGIGGSF